MSRKTVISLKEQLSEGQIIAPYIYDCLTARMAENVGFKTFILSASSVAMSLCVPDVGLLSADDMINAAARVADFLPYPVITEFSGGFSDTPYGVYYNVKRLLPAKVSGVMIDDSMQGMDNAVIPDVQFFAKIAAAIEAAKGSGCMVIAVTNAKVSLGLDACIKRLQECKKLGANLSLCRSLMTLGECERLGNAVPGSKIFDANFCSLGDDPIDLNAAAKYGFTIAAVSYVEKAGLLGLMHFGRRTKQDNTTVYTDYHDYDGELPSMDHHQLLSNQWRDMEMEFKKDLEVCHDSN